MIRALLAIQLGLGVAVVFAILEILAPPPKRHQRQAELSEMIVELSHHIEAIDTAITAEEIEEVERFLGFKPVKITIMGRYEHSPFVTITEDSKN